MKLFKKLAAAALAAVLALTMVGCGSSASLKDELLKLAIDQMTVAGSTATHSKELDALAAKLVQEADKVAGQDAYKGDDAKTILTAEDVVKAAGIDTNANGYIPQCSSECSVQEQRSAYGVHAAAVDGEGHQPLYDERWIQQSREDRNDRAAGRQC